MSANLWKYFFEDDVDKFRQYLADATFSSTAPKTGVGSSATPSKIAGSPGTLSTSPRIHLKSRKSSGATLQIKATGHVLTRGDINAKDGFGRTLLHHAASSRNPRAIEFVVALLEVPFVDLYAQDAESGWTALHRALYFGNIAIAQALMLRDIKDATDYTTNVAHSHAGGLIKIKDHEGNSPFEVFGLTIAPRAIQMTNQVPSIEGAGEEDVTYSMDVYNEDNSQEKHAWPMLDLEGDEVFAFGSNKNYSLGLGDQDDRQYPERISVTRPTHLLHRLHEDLKSQRQNFQAAQDANASQPLDLDQELPALIQNQPLQFQDVIMSKMHTAVLTDDPVSNLYMCGFGPSGRLGTGDEATRFSFVCIEAGGLASRRITTVALGQDHSIAISSRGEVFSWGANQHGQLGYELPEVSVQEIPSQLVPRQLFGQVKKEFVVGAAASAIHSTIFTSSSLYMFGRNEGQLGLMDADARSLEIQIIPRRVGVSVLKSPIKMASAIDRATSVLLESHELIVFTHYGWTKVAFPLHGFTNYFLSEARTARYSTEGTNNICKVTSGGNSICALSTFGEVFTIDVPRKPDSTHATSSTTNPTKARNALPPASRVWSIKKAHTAAIDVTVGQDGSIVLCTAAGSVWRKEKRAKIKSITGRDAGRTKDYKFVRIPNLTRAVAIRSNAFGAYFAVTRDCSVTRDQIVINPQSLWTDLFNLLSFHAYGQGIGDKESPEHPYRFWTPTQKEDSPARIKHAVLLGKTVEEDFRHILARHQVLSDSKYDMWITSSATDVEIPVHAFLMKARSPVMREALADFQNTYYFAIPDIVSVEYGADGYVRARFQAADFLTIMNLVLFLYTETLVDIWHYASKAPRHAAKYRQVRTDLMKIATAFQMPQLERAARLMVDPPKTMHLDFERAILNPDFFQDADVLVELADEVEIPAHSVMLCVRCPFFEGLFHGRAGGRWMANRRDTTAGEIEPIRVDLKHMDARVFKIVLRHIYADTGEELFDKVTTNTLEEFIDVLIDVLSAANELMLDRLAQICEVHIGRYVTTRNVCQLLNTIADCSVTEFKHAALEYICLNLEAMLEYRFLDELDEDLLGELDEVVRQNQLAYQPFTRSQRSQDELIERHPELIQQLEQACQRRIDSMRLRSRLNADDEERPASTGKFRVGSWDGTASSPSTQRHEASPTVTPTQSPAITPSDATPDLLFEMEEEQGLDVKPPSLTLTGSTSTERKDSKMEQPTSSSIKPPMQPSTTTATRKAAWVQSSQVRARVGFKDILEEASATRGSSLIASMPAGSPTSVRSQQKMSQKDRKRLQKEQIHSPPSEERAMSMESPSLTHRITLPASPWRKVETHRPVDTTPQEPLGASSSLDSQVVRDPKEARLATKAGMTMRQTVAGTSAANKPTPRVSSGGLTASSKPLAPQIQSIRHTPIPARSGSSVDARTSMAEILTQQQTEKRAVKEAVAKKSLQEIQQEQEFQEWWDAESRRVQEAEAKAQADTARRGKGHRGRGGGSNRRRSSGGGGGGGGGGGRRGSSSGGTAGAGVATSEGQAVNPPGVAPAVGRAGRRGRGRDSGT